MLMKFREEADYNPAYTFSSEDFEAFRDKASRSLRDVRAFLQKQGYLPAAG